MAATGCARPGVLTGRVRAPPASFVAPPAVNLAIMNGAQDVQGPRSTWAANLTLLQWTFNYTRCGLSAPPHAVLSWQEALPAGALPAPAPRSFLTVSFRFGARWWWRPRRVQQLLQLRNTTLVIPPSELGLLLSSAASSASSSTPGSSSESPAPTTAESGGDGPAYEGAPPGSLAPNSTLELGQDGTITGSGAPGTFWVSARERESFGSPLRRPPRKRRPRNGAATSCRGPGRWLVCGRLCAASRGKRRARPSTHARKSAKTCCFRTPAQATTALRPDGCLAVGVVVEDGLVGYDVVLESELATQLPFPVINITVSLKAGAQQAVPQPPPAGGAAAGAHEDDASAEVRAPRWYIRTSLAVHRSAGQHSSCASRRPSAQVKRTVAIAVPVGVVLMAVAAAATFLLTRRAARRRAAAAAAAAAALHGAPPSKHRGSEDSLPDSVASGAGSAAADGAPGAERPSARGKAAAAAAAGGVEDEEGSRRPASSVGAETLTDSAESCGANGDGGGGGGGGGALCIGPASVDMLDGGEAQEVKASSSCCGLVVAGAAAAGAAAGPPAATAAVLGGAALGRSSARASEGGTAPQVSCSAAVRSPHAAPALARLTRGTARFAAFCAGGASGRRATAARQRVWLSFAALIARSWHRRKQRRLQRHAPRPARAHAGGRLSPLLRRRCDGGGVAGCAQRQRQRRGTRQRRRLRRAHAAWHHAGACPLVGAGV